MDREKRQYGRIKDLHSKANSTRRKDERVKEKGLDEDLEGRVSPRTGCADQP